MQPNITKVSIVSRPLLLLKRIAITPIIAKYIAANPPASQSKTSIKLIQLIIATINIIVTK